MKITMRRRRAVLPTMTLLLLLSGCGGDGSGDADERVDEQPPATGTAANESAVAAASIDWSTIQAGSKEQGIAMAMALARVVTAWHDGAHRYVILRIDADGAVTDAFGNVDYFELWAWKTLVELINDHPQKMFIIGTTPMDYTGDGLGELRKWIYTITVTNPDELQFTRERELES